MANVLELDGSNFQATITEGITLVDFWAPWCGPCRMQGPIIDKVSETLEGKAKFAKVNVDDQQDLAVQFGIQSIPALLIFKDGEVAREFVGVTRANELQSAIEALL